MNTGVSFGFLPGVAVWVLILVLLGLVVVLVREKQGWGRVGLLLILVGGELNVWQRVHYGAVVDPWILAGVLYNNLADYLIVTGLVLYGYSYFVRRQRDNRNR